MGSPGARKGWAALEASEMLNYLGTLEQSRMQRLRLLPFEASRADPLGAVLEQSRTDAD